MTRLQLLVDKRTELINQLIELKVWSASNPTANVNDTLTRIEDQLDELQQKIERLRNE
jgi:hypothetical protein